jgi:hypothetical protein
VGLIIVVFGYIITAVVMFVLGPILYYWVTKSIVKFKNPSLKEYALFWLAWLLSSALLSVVISFFQTNTVINNDVSGYIAQTLSDSLVISILLQAVLAKWIFRESFIKALKATLVYIALFVVSFIIVAFAAIQLGLQAFVGQ